MTRWARRLAWVPLALLLLTGCPAGDRSAVPAARSPAAPASPPPAPAEGAPAGAPELSLLAAVDLSSAAPGVPAAAIDAVPAPDGGAYVVLSPSGGDSQLLVTVDAGFAVAGSVPIPRIAQIWDMHLLPDGTVLVSGQFPAQAGYGYVVADPRTGATRTAVAVPFQEDTSVVHGASVVSPDGATVYLFMTTNVAGRHLDLLLAVDLGSGRQVAARDLFSEVRQVSALPAGPFSYWLVPRPGGGVSVLFNASPTEPQEERLPTLLGYDAHLEPVGVPVTLTRLAENAHAQAVAVTPDGTLYVTAEGDDGTWILALPAGGTSATHVVRLDRRSYDYGLVVDPVEGWAVLPAPNGARGVNLATGGMSDLDVGCPMEGVVLALTRGRELTRILLVGRCGAVSPTPMLWFATT